MIRLSKIVLVHNYNTLHKKDIENSTRIPKIRNKTNYITYNETNSKLIILQEHKNLIWDEPVPYNSNYIMTKTKR